MKICLQRRKKNTVKIALCDDESKFLEELGKQLVRYASENKIVFQIDCFESGDKFLNCYSEHKDYDIIFLDIQMPGMNGIELAKRLREYNDNIIIIFLTSLLQYALDGYRVCALRYLMKPLSYTKLSRELNEILLELKNAKDNYLIVKNDNGVYKIRYEDVIYIETYGRNTMLHTKVKNVLSYKTLKYFEKQLDNRFFRCHSSYLVNLEEIITIEQFDITLSNGDVISLSKNRKHNFSEKMAEFYGNLI